MIYHSPESSYIHAQSTNVVLYSCPKHKCCGTCFVSKCNTSRCF